MRATERQKQQFKEYYQEHKLDLQPKHRAWYKDNYIRHPETRKKGMSKREGKLWLRYGIKLKDWFDMLAFQKSRCAICGIHQDDVKKVFHVDHCHKTNKVRSLLCEECNHGIGNFKDNPNLLLRAFEYLGGVR